MVKLTTPLSLSFIQLTSEINVVNQETYRPTNQKQQMLI
jgi:hypothetical protein